MACFRPNTVGGTHLLDQTFGASSGKVPENTCQHQMRTHKLERIEIMKKVVLPTMLVVAQAVDYHASCSDPVQQSCEYMLPGGRLAIPFLAGMNRKWEGGGGTTWFQVTGKDKIFPRVMSWLCSMAIVSGALPMV